MGAVYKEVLFMEIPIIFDILCDLYMGLRNFEFVR